MPTIRDLRRRAWLQGLKVGDLVEVVWPARPRIREYARVRVVRPNTLELQGRATNFARHSGVARGQDEATGLRLEPVGEVER